MAAHINAFLQLYTLQTALTVLYCIYKLSKMGENKMENNKKLARYIIPIIGALTIIIGAVAFICVKMTSQFNENEKWKDYDECGWY